MPENKVYRYFNIDFTSEDLDYREEPGKVLMCSPDHFKIVDVKNVHMEGHIGDVDKNKAMQQWQDLKAVFERLKEETGIVEEVLVIPGAEGLEDMVFTANQSFPWLLDGEKVVIMSKMRHESRRKEVPYFEEFYKSQGYRPIHLQETELFEGRGDVILHYGRNLIYGGFGHRSDPEAYNEIARVLKCPVLTLKLVDPRFYHLDTCFIPVDEETVFLTTAAFTDKGMMTIERMFKNIIDIPLEEAAENFALNATCMYDRSSGVKIAIIQQGSTTMNEELRKQGFDVIEVDTSEYMKSGGSVFCMKMTMY